MLGGGELANAHGGEINEHAHLFASERFAFGRALDFDDAACAGHDDVHVGIAVRVFRVIEVEHRRTLVDADRDGGDVVTYRVGGQLAGGDKLFAGNDKLSNVERLKFADTGIALDLSGNAGTVAKILGAVFGPAEVYNEVYAGIGLYYIDGGMTYESLMQLAIDARLGAGAGHAAVVDLLYTNVVGVPPGETDRAYFVGLLDTGAYTVAGLGVMAADIDLNVNNINLVGLAGTGLEYVPYFEG